MTNFDFLIRNMGNTLTPELVKGMVQSFQELINAAHKQAVEEAIARLSEGTGQLIVSAEPERALENYQFRVASYEKEREAFTELFHEHLLEIEGLKNPELQRLLSHGETIRREQVKQMVVFVIENKEQLAGYMFVIPMIDLATRRLIASDLYFFIGKEHRKGWLAIRFIKYIERALKIAGVYQLRLGRRAIKDLGPLYRRLGYKDFAFISAKVL